MGFGQGGDKQSSSTTSSISTANIIITDEAGQAATGRTVAQITTAITTDLTVSSPNPRTSHK